MKRPAVELAFGKHRVKRDKTRFNGKRRRSVFTTLAHIVFQSGSRFHVFAAMTRRTFLGTKKPCSVTGKRQVIRRKTRRNWKIWRSHKYCPRRGEPPPVGGGYVNYCNATNTSFMRRPRQTTRRLQAAARNPNQRGALRDVYRVRASPASNNPPPTGGGSKSKLTRRFTQRTPRSCVACVEQPAAYGRRLEIQINAALYATNAAFTRRHTQRIRCLQAAARDRPLADGRSIIQHRPIRAGDFRMQIEIDPVFVARDAQHRQIFFQLLRLFLGRHSWRNGAS